VVDLVQTSMAELARHAPPDLEAVRRRSAPLIAFSDDMRERNLELKRFLRSELYRHYRVHRMSAKALRVIRDLFNAFFADPRLLPVEAQHKVFERQRNGGDSGRARAVADYIAGMTDRYAIKEHQRVYNPGELT
jgi:dGTPase